MSEQQDAAPAPAAPDTAPEASGPRSEDLAAQRTDYYNKWDKLAAASEREAADEDAAASSEANAALGLDKDAPRSEAEQRDREKRVALKEAKQLWDQRKMSEAALRAVFGEDMDGAQLTVTEQELGEKRVVFFKGAKNSEFTLPRAMELKIVKVFIEDCQGCVFHVEQETISSHLEISNCTDCTVNVRAVTHVVQADLCKKLDLNFAPGIFAPEQHKVFHAGLRESTISVHPPGSDAVHSEEVCIVKLRAEEVNATHPEEVQYVSHVRDGRLLTERVFRSRGNMPLTQAEIDEAEARGDGDGLQSLERAAELKKIGGNEAFAENNYAQACVFYREGLDVAPEGSAVVPVLWSNLAFARQKLGHHLEALEAAEAALALDETMTKARFRKGLALHALHRYREAAVELSRAQDEEPKNPQIKQALGFAQMRLAKGGGK